MSDQTQLPVYQKVWGEEHWFVNKENCGKRLVVNRGFRSSIHRHKKMDETFYVSLGRILMERDGSHKVLCPGEDPNQDM